MEILNLFDGDSDLRLLAADPVTLVVAAVGLGVAYFLCTVVYNVFFHPLRHFPGPRLNAMTRIPYALSMLSGRDHLNRYELSVKYGHFVRLAPNVLSVTHPEGMRVVRGHKKAGLENARDPVAMAGYEKNILGADQQQHSKYRRILAPAFTTQAIAQQEPLFRDFGNKLIDRLRETCQSSPTVDVVGWYNWATFDVLGVLAFGESFECLDGRDYHPWVANIFANMKDRAFTAQALYFGRFLAPILMKLFLPRELAGKAKYHNQLSAEKVRKRLAADAPVPDYMSAMLAGKGKDEGLSFEELVSHASVLTVAGSETTATSMACMTYYLGTHPEVLAKVRNEVRSSFATNDEIGLGSMKSLPYLQAVIEETMRIFPAAPLPSPRKISQNGETIAGNYIPAGTCVESPIWVINHHPEFFVRPFEFLPERWIPGNETFENDRLDVVNPFGYGPRICIGKNLAYAEMRMLLSMMLWNFDIELPDEMKNWPEECKGYMIWDKPPLNVRLTPREKA